MGQPRVINVRTPKGTVILFVLVFLVMLLAFGGLAIDIGALVTDRSEIQRATDAAALAGAGKLGFDGSAFPAVRAAAVAYGTYNPTRVAPISLDPNYSNAPAGDIVLGIWDGAAFTPSLDGTLVNAVLCQTRQDVPTSFLGVLGLTSLSMSARSIAVSNPPALPPKGQCPFPFGVTGCLYAAGPIYGSQGCGQPITFINNVSNTGGWVNLGGTSTPSAPATSNAIAYAANGGCPAVPQAGTSSVGANNGMQQSVYNTLSSCNPSDGSGCTGYFESNYTSGHVVTDSSGNTKTYYGWEVYIPILTTSCPPGSFNQAIPVGAYARMIMTQVINNGWCGENNTLDKNSMAYCPPSSTVPGGKAVRDPNLRAIFGYFDCGKWKANPVVGPAPRAALADRLRLVQ